MSDLVLEVFKDQSNQLHIKSEGVKPSQLKEIVNNIIKIIVDEYMRGAKEKKLIDTLDLKKLELAKHTIITQLYEESYFNLLNDLGLLKKKSDIIAPN